MVVSLVFYSPPNSGVRGPVRATGPSRACAYVWTVPSHTAYLAQRARARQ